MAWIVGQNMPGYLPESDPYAFDGFTEARDYLLETLKRDEDNVYMSDYTDNELRQVSAEFRAARGEVRRMRASTLGVTHSGTVYAANLAYWIHHDPIVDADEYNRENVEGYDI